MTTRADAHKPDFHRDSAYPQPVRAATTANITIATALNNGDSLDGLTLATGDRVLVKDQSTGAENGIYIVGVTPVRADDMDTGLEAWGCIVKVQAGTVNANTLWTNTNTTLPTIGSTALTFVAAGGGAPTGADYLVGTAQGGLSAEIVVGTTPGGELGGTWASPTVDATHAGSTHDAATNTHIADTADAHDASAISVVPTGSLTSTDVQAALAELDGDISAGGIPATIFDAKGDLIAASAADTAARLAAAANGAALITASGESTGLKWRLNNDGASAAPTVNDDAGDGYSIGSRWLDTTNDKEYVCLDATTTAAVWVETTGAGGGGSDLVQTYSGGGSVYIPGLRGSPDRISSSPSSDDDEFNSLSGWTTLGTLDTNNISDVPSHLHIKRTLGAVGADGLYKTAPSMPFTVTIKFGAKLVQNYDSAGILLTEASPGKLCTFGLVSNSATYYTSIYRWTNRSTFSTNIDVNSNVPTLSSLPYPYIRLIVASSTDITGQVSHDGMYWHAPAGQSNVTSSLTVANVGVYIGDAAAAGTTEMYVDWIRFT